MVKISTVGYKSISTVGCKSLTTSVMVKAELVIVVVVVAVLCMVLDICQAGAVKWVQVCVISSSIHICSHKRPIVRVITKRTRLI